MTEAKQVMKSNPAWETLKCQRNGSNNFVKHKVLLLQFSAVHRSKQPFFVFNLQLERLTLTAAPQNEKLQLNE